MDEQFGDELRSLRQRAYGPDADIQEDPVAFERLRQLEAQTAVRRSVSDDGEREGDPDPETETEPEPEPVLEHGSHRLHVPLQGAGSEGDSTDTAGPTAELAPTAEPEPDQAESIPSDTAGARRRGALIWAGALTGALLVGAALSYVAVGLTPGSVGVLQVDPDGDWPDDFSPRASGSEIFEEFHGLTVVLVPQDWNGGAPSPCLFILSNASEGLIGGAGCGAGDFDPIAAIAVTEQMPKSLIEAFPVGSALQFQLREGEVVVFADLP